MDCFCWSDTHCAETWRQHIVQRAKLAFQSLNVRHQLGGAVVDIVCRCAVRKKRKLEERAVRRTNGAGLPRKNDFMLGACGLNEDA